MRKDFITHPDDQGFYNHIEHMTDREIQEKIAFDTNCTRKKIEFISTVIQVYIFLTVLAVLIFITQFK